MKSRHLFLGAAASCMTVSLQAQEHEVPRPNIIIILADDMGYSDIGCYGSEIPTPNIDKLALSGVRFTQFYNNGRSCPSRASLLTGLYSHQTGIGAMAEDPNTKPVLEDCPPGYYGYLNDHCVTIAEVLKSAGYDTYMAGKWHVGMHGQDKWPLSRGFDRYYGILAGACSYLKPKGGRGLTMDNNRLPAPEGDYYTTDAFTDKAIDFISERDGKSPFFLYLAYNAPHWPLQAKDDDIAMFRGKYDDGWQEIRDRRVGRMKELGLIPQNCGLAEWESRMWNELTQEEKSASSERMSVYAAQVYSMDRNIGRLMNVLDEKGYRDNTIVFFLSDNGACAEPYTETGWGSNDDINNAENWLKPSYGLPWAQVSNTPFRKYKVRAYEGGISTPLIVSWPEGIGDRNGDLITAPGHIVDIMPTCIEVSGAEYPALSSDGNEIYPMEGKSILPAINDGVTVLHEYIYGEHIGNRYVRFENWKALMDEKTKKWELYDISADRIEAHNLADEYPEVLSSLISRWQNWADTHHVFPKK